MENAIYMTVKNDVSFVVDMMTLNIYEHQSTVNPHMPIRDLDYVTKTFAKFYEKSYPIEDAINLAIDECIRRSILADFLKKNRNEVVSMSIFEALHQAVSTLGLLHTIH